MLFPHFLPFSNSRQEILLTNPIFVLILEGSVADFLICSRVTFNFD